MANYAVIAVEGVLARTGQDGAITTPIPEGQRLFTALRRYYKLALVSLADDSEMVETWLRKNGYDDYTLLWGPVGLAVDAHQVRADQLMDIRSRGYAIELYLDASPLAVAAAMQLGITSLAFMSPSYSRPEFRPDAPKRIREWSAIEAELEVQRKLRDTEPVRTADLHE